MPHGTIERPRTSPEGKDYPRPSYSNFAKQENILAIPDNKIQK